MELIQYPLLASTWFGIALAAVFAVVVIAGILSCVKIIKQQESMVIERLGQYSRTLESGLNIIVPVMDRPRPIFWRYKKTDISGIEYVVTAERTTIDLREQVFDFAKQNVITRDNVTIEIDAMLYFQITNTHAAVYEIANLPDAIEKLCKTSLRNVVGKLDLDECLTSRDKINSELGQVMDDATDKWGVRVVRVEIQRIDPPPEVVSAMHAQMKAERDRRATVTEAQGYQEAAIARADGEQQSAVLAAEGRKQAAILDAEGESQAIELRARADKLRLQMIGEGEGMAANARLTGIKEANADEHVITVEYLAALERIGDGRATKLVIPAEFSGLLGTVAALTEVVRPDDSEDEVRPKDGLPIPDDDNRVSLPEPDRAAHRRR